MDKLLPHMVAKQGTQDRMKAWKEKEKKGKGSESGQGENKRGTGKGGQCNGWHAIRSM